MCLCLLFFSTHVCNAYYYREGDQSVQSSYLKKPMLGGVLLFEIHFQEPFFVVKLRVIECNRLQSKASTALTNQVSFIIYNRRYILVYGLFK